MNGREETARKYEKNANDILERTPSYLRDFYRSIGDLSHTTKFVYLKYVLEFLDYVELNYFMDVTDINFIKDIKPSMLKSYMSNMKDVGDSLKAAKMYGIKKFFDYCFDDFIIDVNPFNRIVKQDMFKNGLSEIKRLLCFHCFLDCVLHLFQN